MGKATKGVFLIELDPLNAINQVIFNSDLFLAMGTGRSKKEAKHAAAKAVLDKMVVAQEEGTNSSGANSTVPET